MKESIWFEPGIYQYEFTDDKIAISKWDDPPTSTSQWVKVVGLGKFKLIGSSNDDICVHAHEDNPPIERVLE